MRTRIRANRSRLSSLLVSLVLAGCLGGQADLAVANRTAATQTVHVAVSVDEKDGVRELLNHTFVVEPAALQDGNLGIRGTHTFHVAARTETGLHNSSTFRAADPAIFVRVFEGYVEISFARP